MLFGSWNVGINSTSFSLLNTLLQFQIKSDIHAATAYRQRWKWFPKYFEKIFISYQIHFLVEIYGSFAIQSITTIAFKLSANSGTVVGHDSPSRFFTSLASSDLVDFRNFHLASDKTKGWTFLMIVETGHQTLLILNNQRFEENWLCFSSRQVLSKSCLFT